MSASIARIAIAGALVHALAIPLSRATQVGEQADVAASAYAYRADRSMEENPPEAAILLMQYANLPFDRPLDPMAPAITRPLTGLLFEEVRPIRRVELTWAKDLTPPLPGSIELDYFDATDDAAHTWWNPRTIREADPPVKSADGRTYVYTIPVDTWGLVVAMREGSAKGVAVPTIRALVPEVWKELDIEIEWGFTESTKDVEFDGGLEAYDGILADVEPLAGERHGVKFRVLYIGTSRWRKVWPYLAQPEDVARTIVTLRNQRGPGGFSFLVSDLEQGPILAPEQGFFARAASPPRGASALISPPPFQVLSDRLDSVEGIPRVVGWGAHTAARPQFPWAGVNPATESSTAGSLVVPARSVVVHPATNQDVAVVWTSPIEGSVKVAGRVAMADGIGGNGVRFTLVHDGKNGRSEIAAGDVGNAKDRRIELGVGDAIDVARGDVLALIVDAKDQNYTCDTTIVDLAVAEVSGELRTWDLARDVVDSIHRLSPEGAPASAAPREAWTFCAVDAPAPTPAPSEPPFDQRSNAKSAREFVAELKARNLRTIRERVRAHDEQSWAGAMEAMFGSSKLPSIPAPAFEPAMQIDVPSPEWNAQWKLAAWHILRRSVQDEQKKWSFNDYPFGILASETAMILRALDLQGMHQEAGDGLDQWLGLQTSLHVVPGQNGHHALALPDRPLGHFSDGDGAFTHAVGPYGWGGNMDGVHAMGPGAIVFPMYEHYRLTGDIAWLKKNVPRMQANAEWIVRQRHLLESILPGGARSWSKGLQPAQVVTPDSMSMHMQFYESEAYYWLAVERTAEMLTVIDRDAGAKLAGEADAYKKDLLAAIDRSILRTPVVAVRDGTYHSFIPFAPYVRGFAAGAWGYRRCQGHVGAIYWDTVQSADPLISPSGLLSATDPRVQGHLDVLEDRLLLENTKVHSKTAGYDADRDYFSHASWQYQCGLERHANIHLAGDDVPNYLRSLFNQYAVDIMPGEYTFREHTTGGPPDKLFEESCFIERFREMLVMEDGDQLWLARATPRAWLEDGKKIAVRNAPTWFGTVNYEIVSDLKNTTIRATLELPAQRPPRAIVLRLRHPTANRMKSVSVDGHPYSNFDPASESITLALASGRVVVEARY